MSDFLKKYRVCVEILTPVHIGLGQEITKKEYIYYKNTKQAWIPNKRRFFQDIIQRNLLDDFENYMLNGTEPLLNWMKSVGYTDKAIQKLCDYNLDSSEALENLNRPVAIQEFVKDAYGLPYIPGSSLKGAIRSSLLGSRILSGKEHYSGISRSIISSNDMIDGRVNKKYLAQEGKKVEEVAFHTLDKVERISDAKNDELKGVYISDSAPLQPECLVLCQKVDLSPERKKNSLNILRESIKPGTIVEFEMTVDTTIIDLTPKEIELALAETWNFYQKEYVRKFISIMNQNKGNLYLGGGCGFGTKTVLFELLEEKERLQVTSKLMNLKFRKHGHRNDVRRGASPHMLKCTNYGGKICEMGKCHVTITET